MLCLAASSFGHFYGLQLLCKQGIQMNPRGQHTPSGEAWDQLDITVTNTALATRIPRTRSVINWWDDEHSTDEKTCVCVGASVEVLFQLVCYWRPALNILGCQQIL